MGGLAISLLGGFEGREAGGLGGLRPQLDFSERAGLRVLLGAPEEAEQAVLVVSQEDPVDLVESGLPGLVSRDLSLVRGFKLLAELSGFLLGAKNLRVGSGGSDPAAFTAETDALEDMVEGAKLASAFTARARLARGNLTSEGLKGGDFGEGLCCVHTKNIPESQK